MPQSYTPEFKKKIVRLHLEEGRTYKSITAEYGVSKASISKWCSEFSEECQAKADINPNTLNEAELMKEILRLRRELEESRKENLFLKKAAAFLNIINCLAYAGCFAGSKSVQTHTITTGNTGRRIIMPGKQKYRHRFRRFIILTMVSTVIGA